MRAALRRARRGMQMIFQDPYASLNPRWRVADIVAEPMRALRRRASRGELDGARRRAARAGRARRGRRRQVSASVLRRPAAAHLDRARAVDQPGVPRLRRADVRARRVGAGAGAEPDARPAAAARPHVPVHLAQSGGRPSHRRPRRRDVPRAASSSWRRPASCSPSRSIRTRGCCSMRCPDLEMTGEARTAVAGEVPNPLDPPPGCTFHPRCPLANERCRRESPVLRPAGVDQHGAGRLPRGRGGPAAAARQSPCTVALTTRP